MSDEEIVQPNFRTPWTALAAYLIYAEPSSLLHSYVTQAGGVEFEFLPVLRTTAGDLITADLAAKFLAGNSSISDCQAYAACFTQLQGRVQRLKQRGKK